MSNLKLITLRSRQKGFDDVPSSSIIRQSRLTGQRVVLLSHLFLSFLFQEHFSFGFYFEENLLLPRRICGKEQRLFGSMKFGLRMFYSMNLSEKMFFSL